jgi:hypothetical protein
MRKHGAMTKVSVLMALTIASSGLAACGGSSGGGVRTVTVAPAATSAQETSTYSPPNSGDAILIETRIPDAKLHAGEVLGVSVIGESAFCPGGKTSGGSEGPTITTTFHCPGGTLTVRYAPTQPSLVQSAVWEIASGTGRFERLRGGGSMVAKFKGGHLRRSPGSRTRPVTARSYASSILAGSRDLFTVDLDDELDARTDLNAPALGPTTKPAASAVVGLHSRYGRSGRQCRRGRRRPYHQFWEPADRHAAARRMAVDAAAGIAASGRDAFVFRVELRLGERRSIVSTSHKIYLGKAKGRGRRSWRVLSCTRVPASGCASSSPCEQARSAHRTLPRWGVRSDGPVCDPA